MPCATIIASHQWMTGKMAALRATTTTSTHPILVHVEDDAGPRDGLDTRPSYAGIGLVIARD